VTDCDLIVAGNDEEGYQRRLEAMVRQLGVDSRVAFIGAVDARRKSELLRQAVALILPSYSENFGNVVLEAMAEGCPAIVTPEVGAAEIVRRTGGGVVLEGQPDALAAGLNKVLAQPQALRAMGEQARSAIAEQFSWQAIARSADRIYRRILAGSSQSTSALQARANVSPD
jgi:glycosyltransferase involved in cell wall biosynthesis